MQQRQLLDILRHNAATEYGIGHGFAAIRDYAEYRERVPIVTYDDVRADIGRMAAGAANVLTHDPPLAFEETGGSSGGHKLLPYTASALAAFRHALLPWIDDLALHHPQLARGKAYWAISPAARTPRVTPGGTPIGLESDAAYFGDALAPLLPPTLAVPPAIAALRDIDAWRSASCAHLLACEALALISVWSPTFLLDLLGHMREYAEALTAGLRGGAYAGLQISAARSELARVVLRADHPDYRQLWPRLVVVSCWDHAASRPYAETLRMQLGDIALQGKGLLATEGAISLPLCGINLPVLALESGFFEFRDAAGVCRDASDLSNDCDYDVLMTTWGGLYRYDIGDRVRVRGFAGEAPLLEFIGRGGVTCDLCGEKLTEAFVIRALQPLGLRFALLAPAAGARAYRLFVDAAEVSASGVAGCAARAEAALCANPQYAYARTLGQLAALDARRCVQPLHTWQRGALERGMRLGDIKPPALSPLSGWDQRFNAA